MYDFHKNRIKQKYGDKAKLLFTDTDSLTYEIETKGVNKDFWKDKDKFDNSNFYDKTNKKVIIGKFKDEAAGFVIKEFAGLRSKISSNVKDNKQNNKTVKWIKKNVIKKDIKHEDYKNTLFEEEQMYHKIKTIRSDHYQLASYEVNEVSSSCFDDKRYIRDNGISSHAYRNAS